jgi:hypothetical protein
MSATPQRLSERRDETPAAIDEESASSLWHWFAIGVLLFCWIAEATISAGSGF